MKKKSFILFCLCLASLIIITVCVLFIPNDTQPVSSEDDILIGLKPAYNLIKKSELAKKNSKGEYLGYNNTRTHGVVEDITPGFYDREAPVIKLIVKAGDNVTYKKPDNVYGEKWAFESLSNGPDDMDKGMASALHFLSTIQFLAAERQEGIYENFVPIDGLIHLALDQMDYEYIRTELSDGFVIELIGGVQIRFYEDDQNRIPYAELIVQDIVNAKNEPLILEINLQTKLMREENETEYQVPERKSTLITQHESEDAP